MVLVLVRLDPKQSAGSVSQAQAGTPSTASRLHLQGHTRTRFQSPRTVGRLPAMVGFIANLICFFYSLFHLEEKEPGHGKVDPHEQMFEYGVDIQKIFLEQKLGCCGED